MLKLKDKLVQKGKWSDLIMGNYAIARGMIDSGTSVITTFPGSPTPEIANALCAVDEDKRNYYFEYSTNEKVALEIATGASLNGRLSSVFFKSVGLNVAADSLIQLPMMNLIGGMVIILGDDPGAHSSQNEQDNRVFARMSYIPMLEPANPQEAYDMYKEAASLSKKHQCPVFLRLTTHVCHAREVVNFDEIENNKEDWSSKFDKKNGPYFPIVKAVFPLKKMALKKLNIFEKYGNQSRFNKLIEQKTNLKNDSKSIGIISSALPALSILENLEETNVNADLLSLGMTYPIPKKLILDFLKNHDEVLIVEELDRVLETEIKSLAFDEKITSKIMCRTGIDELMGELDPHRTMELLARNWPSFFEVENFNTKNSDEINSRLNDELNVVPRIPQMCPGCGHRAAFHAIRKTIPKDAITVADIGCHSLGFLPPYNVGEVLLSMGHSVSTGSGLTIGNKDRKVLSMLGDATLFHAAMPGIVNASIYNHDLTLVILDNGTTAMTGHQPRFGTGEIGDKISIEKLLETMGVSFIKVADAYDQAAVSSHLKEAMDHKGFAVVIARHPCMLKFTRERKKQYPNAQLPVVLVDQETCTKAMTCIAEFGCPSFKKEEDGSIVIHPDLCIKDGSCISVCSSQAIVRKKRGEK